MKSKSKSKSYFKPIIFSIIIIAVIIGLVFMLKNKSSNTHPTKVNLNNIPTVTAVKISQHVIPKTIASYGTTISPNSMVIRPQSSGVLLSIEFSPGEKIKQNQLLFTLKNNDIDNQSIILNEQLRTSKSQYQRYEKQNKELPGSISEMDLLIAKSKYQQDLDAYKKAGEFENIHAPISGLITEAGISPGDFVSEGQELAEIVDASALQVKYQLSSQYTDQVKLGQTIYFYPEDNENKDSIYTGTVSYISPQLDQDTYNLVLRADVQNQKNLRPNHFGKIMQVINNNYSALAVPQGLVKVDEKGFYFYSVIKNNQDQDQDQGNTENQNKNSDLYKIKKQYFTPGQITRSGLIEVSAGMESNTLIINSYTSEITPGETVRLVD